MGKTDPLGILAKASRGGQLDPAMHVGTDSAAWPEIDCTSLPVVVQAASGQTRTGSVVVSAEFDGGRNHSYVLRQVRARNEIPAKRVGRRPGVYVECMWKCAERFMPTLPTAGSGRAYLLVGEAQTRGFRARPLVTQTAPPSPAARVRPQSLLPEAFLTCRAVNKAT